LMEIEAYCFGEIKIDGKVYDHDVILAGSEVRRWVRKESHNVLWEEVENLLDFSPEVIIIGTGSVGVMKVSPKIIAKLRERGVEVVVERTGRASEIFDEFSKKKKVVAALHLTC